MVLWTCRITHSLGQAAAIFYLQDLSYSRIGDKPRILPNLGKESYRVNAMEMRCGDVVRLDGIEESGINPNRTINLLGYLQTVRGEALETCSNHVVMDSYQARYHQVSNYGRKAILAIQCCSEACAKKLADMVNHNWVTTTALIREHRPLRKLAGKTSQP